MSKDEEEDEDYDEPNGGSRLLGFMFGNVDNSGDLDVDYLDEDAKEHLAALADKLGPSLTIDLIKSSPSPADASEQDFDEKAEDAIDYEDIDEQYDGPEVESATEEDRLLPKVEFFSGNTVLSSLENTKSVFDEENYDEEDESAKETDISALEDQNLASAAANQSEMDFTSKIHEDDNLNSVISPESDNMTFDEDEFQEENVSEEEQSVSGAGNSLPVLCVEDGLEILRFSEIFGVQEPPRRSQWKVHHKYKTRKDPARTFYTADMVEEDEEVFLRKSFKDLYIAKDHSSSVADGQVDMGEESSVTDNTKKDFCICAQPMKDDWKVDMFEGLQSQTRTNIYAIDQQEWESSIIWGNSPTSTSAFSERCAVSEPDVEVTSDADFEAYGQGSEYNKSGKKISTHGECSQISCQPQLEMSKVSKKVSFCSNSDRIENGAAKVTIPDSLSCFDKLHFLNKELIHGSWVDQIIWDSSENIPKPKLILDLQDEQMLFEVLDNNIAEHLRSHAGAMVIERSSQCFAEESHDVQSHGVASGGRFNISNDKFYFNRKTSQQAKSHAKKRALGIKIMHSIPALKLQTMKPKLSNKEISNFHRPKALWFPRFNEVAAKFEGALCNEGHMVIVVTSLGGKPIKLQVNAEDTMSTLKMQLFKKFELSPAETMKVIYHGRELDDDKTLSDQNVRPNSVLHVVRSMIHLWPKAQKLPGENKPLRPPGAFKRRSDLSVKDGHVFLMEYCEERPLLLGNVGMCARLCTYYQKTSPGDQTAAALRDGNSGLGAVLTLDPADKSPFLGEIGPGCSQSCLETNMYRAPVFPHKLSTTDFLLVRSAKGMLSLRRIDKLYVIGQQEPHMEVPTPGSKVVQTYLVNRMLVYVYREFRAREKPGFFSYVRADELGAQFPGLTDAFIKKRMKHCADLKRSSNGQLLWVKKNDFRIPSEEELRRMLVPENVCSYESMQVGLYRLKQLGINRLTLPSGLSTAMNQLPDEAIVLAAASHIERELQITSWNLTSNFISCISQNKENIERLEITGVGDPSGRGLGFSYVKVAPKAPIANTVVKKKATAAKGQPAVTGTDADLRRLSMEAARELLLKFGIPDEQISKLTRWHRIALIRKLSSEKAASGVTVDATTLSKFARGQRMSFLQLQQQTREKCQEIWDRQYQSLFAADGDQNDSESEANSDLDSFAGDLENLLDAEEFEDDDDSNKEVKADKLDGVRGFKMRRCPSQVQTEEIEDDEAEAAAIIRLLEDDGAAMKKKKKKIIGAELRSQTSKVIKTKVNIVGHLTSTPHSDGLLTPKKFIAGDPSEVFKEKKTNDRPVRETFVCGACGQLGHMRTNKNCPKYGEDLDLPELGTIKPNLPDGSQLHYKKLVPKLTKTADMKALEYAENVGLKPHGKVVPVKFKCSSADKPEKNLVVIQAKDKQIPDTETDTRSTGKISKFVIPNKMKSTDVEYESHRSSVLIRLPAEIEKEKPRKKIVIRQPKSSTSFEPVREVFDFDMDSGFRKTKKITELSNFNNQREHEKQWLREEPTKSTSYGRRLWEEDGKRKNKERFAEEKTRRTADDRRRMQEEEQWFSEFRGYDTGKREELKRSGNKKKKKPDYRDEYFLEHRSTRSERRIPERDRAAKRRVTYDSGQFEYGSSTKRRRGGGEVELNNILLSIADSLRDNVEISYLFLKPVTKKDAPDYLDIIRCPMDLSTIKGKARNMEYRHHTEFRHDVWQITYNAHIYNDARNPDIPPLADQLLELCDYFLEQRIDEITSVEEEIDN